MFKAIGSALGAVAATAIVLTAQAAEASKVYPEKGNVGRSQAPVVTPLAFPQSTLIYIVPGARDDTGISTAVVCTNVSGGNVTLRFVALNYEGSVKGSGEIAFAHGNTRAVLTRPAAMYSDDMVLNTGLLNEGSIYVYSTSSTVFCTASIVDATSHSPQGFDLHMIRFNPHPKAQE